ncbi:uncharacterized protein An14g02260 [Aspergillus niger]|uniref:Contig An14c0100, genomic contig n=2 Tax=Aspergillus niger TaxID=5061 RepID=A2R2X2_ASPNC|nr:uncharacterized protein An14g02260 [Aspergillus niger]CAK41963.1 unnamed protein product [Aspergillus niger]
MSSSLEAKIVVLGAQGVGKTSLVDRYVKNDFNPSATASTVGASFVTKRVLDSSSDTIVRLQIWDTAGQERFRSISRLYYRGANACLLCYDITDEQSFQEMTGWLAELKKNIVEDDPIVIHVVGTKTDIVTLDPSRRRVPFERTIAYDIGWDCCHEISAKDGEGIEEVFRVITRKLVEQRNKREAGTSSSQRSSTVFDGTTSSLTPGNIDGNGSFRLGYGDKRRSWLGFPPSSVGDELEDIVEGPKRKGGQCC